MKKLLFILSLALANMAWGGDWVVIVHPNSGVNQLSKSEVINIFMGRYRKFPSGQNAMPLDMLYPASGREQFYRGLINKELAEVDSYWARLKFSGQIAPPLAVDSSEAVIQMVANNINYIGYCDKNKVNDKVKIVFDLNR
jgi:ABC-type phosphate transport system substrate-binding protein